MGDIIERKVFVLRKHFEEQKFFLREKITREIVYWDKFLSIQKVAGEYETSKPWFSTSRVFLKNGVSEYYIGKTKIDEGRWSIVNDEIHSENKAGTVKVYRINHDSSITWIAYVVDGKRLKRPEPKQYTYTKIETGTFKAPRLNPITGLPLGY